MKALPNLLSAIRLLATLFFLTSSYSFYFIAVVIAVITDVLDGYLARRLGAVSRIGAWLDPLADKCFVVGAIIRLIFNAELTVVEILCFFARDISLALFSVYLWVQGYWASYRIASFICGKIVTALQFLTLSLFFLEIKVPLLIFMAMGLFGVLSLVELLARDNA